MNSGRALTICGDRLLRLGGCAGSSIFGVGSGGESTAAGGGDSGCGGGNGRFCDAAMFLTAAE